VRSPSQGTLFPGLDRQADFDRFDRENPAVYRLFRRFALEALAVGGRRRFGARMIGERIRWYAAVETSGHDFKVNDHLWPFYARKFMADHPQHAGAFETRGGW